jgi:hypothetical protein
MHSKWVTRDYKLIEDLFYEEMRSLYNHAVEGAMQTCEGAFEQTLRVIWLFF